MNQKVYCIADVCSNWGPLGEWPSEKANAFSKALSLIRMAAECGVDAVKFQLFRAESLYRRNSCPPGLEDYELPIEWIDDLVEYAHDHGLDFVMTPFWPGAVNALNKVDAIKIASGDLLYTELWDEAVKLEKQIYFSTGAAMWDEVEAVWEKYLGVRLIPMHCVSAYPAAIRDCNLNSIKTLLSLKNCGSVGWSDHCATVWSGGLAVAAGASVIEVHICRDEDDREAGHSLVRSALEPYVRAICAVEQVMGWGDVTPSAVEKSERINARRGSDGLRPA